MRFLLGVGAAFAVLGVGAVCAQIDPIKTRREIMKGVGEATGDLGKMAKGEAPFDLAKAKAGFKNYADASARMVDLYPDSSKEGGGTHALPKIWETKADFIARFQKFGKEATEAEAATKDLAMFKRDFAAVVKNCGNCHELYRQPIHS